MKKKVCLAGIFVATTVLLSACGSVESGEGGVSQKKYDKVVEEKDELEEEIKEKDKKISELEETVASLEAQLKEAGTSGSQSGVSGMNQEIDEAGSAQPNVEAGKGTADESSVELLAEYTLSDGMGWYTRHFLIVKNDSSEAMNIKSSSLAYDTNGSLVGAADAEIDVLGSGCTSCFYEAIETDATIDHYDTTIKANNPKHYNSITEYLTYDLTQTNNGAVIKVTNNGDYAGEFVEGTILFFKNDELIGFDTAYFTDDDYEIKSGDTITKQFTTFDSFDRVEFYLNGRASK